MSMTTEEFLKSAERQLQDAGVGTARLDSLVLLEDLLEIDRANILAHPEQPVDEGQLAILNEQINRRARHIPLAYIRGKTEFYGRTFVVNDHVLEPRPESETLIDLYKYLPGHENLTVADIGTGSGALAITLKLDMPRTTVYAIDIDERCLELAGHNARKLQADVIMLHGDLLQPLVGHQLAVDALLCNLPYVPDTFQLNTAATHEPRLAIFGGEDGLDPFRALFAQTAELSRPPTYILTESMPPQHGVLADIAGDFGYALKQSEDFVQVFRLVNGQKQKS